MSDIAVDVRGVSKRFRLAHGRHNSLKERVIHGGRTPHEDFWALKDVSLVAREGETVGILGRNGSGKSTLLKCICGVLQPTSGEVVVRGKLAGLLELGAGFQQDLTGRENVYLNGSMLGMSKKEVDRVFDDIVDFSELEEFIDGPVKFYSSGHVRPPRLRGGGQRGPRHPGRRRGAGGGRRALPAQVHRAGEGLPARGPHHPVGHPLAGPGALHLRPGRGVQPRRRHPRGRPG